MSWSWATFSANLGKARARITIPAQTPRGRWHLMFCDDGCRTAMGSVIPAPVRVSTPAAMARTARRMSVLAEQRGHELADPPAPAAAWSWLSAVGGALAVLLLGGATLRLRRRQTDVDAPPVDLTSGEPTALVSRPLEAVGSPDQR